MFKFGAMWASNHECSEIIDNVWSVGVKDSSFKVIMNMITNCSLRFTYWNKTKFGNA